MTRYITRAIRPASRSIDNRSREVRLWGAHAPRVRVSAPSPRRTLIAATETIRRGRRMRHTRPVCSPTCSPHRSPIVSTGSRKPTWPRAWKPPLLASSRKAGSAPTIWVGRIPQWTLPKPSRTTRVKGSPTSRSGSLRCCPLPAGPSDPSPQSRTILSRLR
jgi:hypothetical protein